MTPAVLRSGSSPLVRRCQGRRFTPTNARVESPVRSRNDGRPVWGPLTPRRHQPQRQAAERLDEQRKVYGAGPPVTSTAGIRSTIPMPASKATRRRSHARSRRAAMGRTWQHTTQVAGGGSAEFGSIRPSRPSAPRVQRVFLRGGHRRPSPVSSSTNGRLIAATRSPTRSDGIGGTT